MKKRIDFDSIENQNIKSDLVNKEVYCNVGTMVEYILSKGWEDSEAPFSYEELNTYRYTYNGVHASFHQVTEDEVDNIVDELREQLEKRISKKKREEIEEEIDEIERLESEPVDIFEWWAVSSWLAEKLEAKGEIIIDSGCTNVWGRRTSGQAISLDWVISDICNDLGWLK